MAWLITGGRVVDPANDLDGIADVLVERGKVARVGGGLSSGNGVRRVDARGKLVLPGFIDMHTHLRQPGREDKETIASGSRAGARGGFTSVCAMANTQPVTDTRGAVEFIQQEAERSAVIKVYPVGSVSKGLRGEELAELAELAQAGVVALSDDGQPVRSAELMRRALEYARMLDLVIIPHCEDPELAAGGVMHEGLVSAVLGLRGIPAASETTMVLRDLELAAMTGGRIHIAHVSTARSVELLREAKQRGVRVTCETCPHYFVLTDEAVRGFRTNAKMNPPLRTGADVAAIKAGLQDGTIDAIATDHAPHTQAEKELEFDRAPFGIVGLETACGLAMTHLVQPGVLTVGQLVERMARQPARILGIPGGSLSPGEDADLVIVDPDAEWDVRAEDFASRSTNSPFLGWRLKGRVELTLSRGKAAYERERSGSYTPRKA